jgi:hypothetical protein
VKMESGKESQLHHLMIRGLLDTGRCPSNADLERALKIGTAELVALLRNLEAAHGVVLHPDRPEPWVIHPFSLTPTATWVQGPGRGWWAPCLWCAFGIAALAGGEVQMYTHLGGENESAIISVRDGEPLDSQKFYVHFAIPPAQAWNNVHAHCAMVLPFRSRDDVKAWTSRHALPSGEVIPLPQVAALARKWYGSHADPDWRKWTIAEAQEIFASVGLLSEFWSLGAQAGRF